MIEGLNIRSRIFLAITALLITYGVFISYSLTRLRAVESSYSSYHQAVLDHEYLSRMFTNIGYLESEFEAYLKSSAYPNQQAQLEARVIDLTDKVEKAVSELNATLVYANKTDYITKFKDKISIFKAGFEELKALEQNYSALVLTIKDQEKDILQHLSHVNDGFASSGHYQIAERTAEVMREFLLLRFDQLNALILRDSTEYGILGQHFSRFDDSLDLLKKDLGNVLKSTDLEYVLLALPTYREKFQNMIDLNKQKQDLLNASIGNSLTVFRDDVLAFQNEMIEAGNLSDHSLIRSIHQMKFSFLLGAISCLVLGVGLAILVSSSIAAPLMKLSEYIKKDTASGLKGSIQPVPFVSSQNEIGDLARAVHQFRMYSREVTVVTKTEIDTGLSATN